MGNTHSCGAKKRRMAAFAKKAADFEQAVNTLEADLSSGPSLEANKAKAWNATIAVNRAGQL